MLTLADVESVWGVSHMEWLDKATEIPVVTRIASQGDILMIRKDDLTPSHVAIPQAGVDVIAATNGGHAHTLLGSEGYFTFTNTVSARNVVVGVLTVPLGVQVLLDHPEHGSLLLSEGSWEIRRQREDADRLVQD